MKIIHIMKKQKFTAATSQFYDIYFNNGEHEICYFRQQADGSLIQKDISVPQREVCFGRNILAGLLRFYRVIKPYDYIVFHSYLYPYWLKVFLGFVPGIAKKLVWIEWGADLYTWKISRHNPLVRFKNFVEKRIRTKCAVAVCIFPPDCDYYRKEFPKSKAKVFYAPYCGSKIPEAYKTYSTFSQLTESRSTNDTIYIQVGHSATPMVDHIATLDALKRFSDRNIKLLLPLNYGDKAYGDMVQAYAEAHFPGKVRCLRDMLAKDEYFDLIKRVDIAIFQTHRQIALGNLNRMFFQNVKVYLPEGSVMHRFFAEKGAPVHATEELMSCDFDALISDPEKKDPARFDAFIAGYTDMDAKVNHWKMIYDNLRGDTDYSKGINQ